MTGAAYASSSANAPPSSTFPATIASFGFIHQPNTVGSHDSASLPASDGLTAGRGCPVGDAAGHLPYYQPPQSNRMSSKKQ